jgi:multidrug efflux pump subunit AcrA (membrane-fusion protein)
VYVAIQKGAEWVAEKKTIKTGLAYDGTTEILEGLALGDKVITTGFQGLNAGAKIEF